MMRALTLGVVALTVMSAAASPEIETDAAVRAAITSAIQARMGPETEVTIDAVSLHRPWPHASARVRIDPGARLGRPLRVALGAAADPSATTVAWTGSADAEVRVVAAHLHARRPVPRGATISDADVVVVRHAVDGPLRPWPAADAVGRSRALRDLAPDACLTPSTLLLLPLVQAGQTVQATLRLGELLAEASLVAAENGERGEVIRVVNPRSRRTIKARVVGVGHVEVIL